MILSHSTRNVVTVCATDQSESETRLTTPLGLAAIGVDWGLFGIWLSCLNALESWLPLCGRQSTEAIVEQPYVALSLLGEPMLARWSVHGVVDHDMPRAVGLGLAISRECTSIKGAEQRMPGSI